MSWGHTATSPGLSARVSRWPPAAPRTLSEAPWLRDMRLKHPLQPPSQQVHVDSLPRWGTQQQPAFQTVFGKGHLPCPQVKSVFAQVPPDGDFPLQLNCVSSGCVSPSIPQSSGLPTPLSLQMGRDGHGEPRCTQLCHLSLETQENGLRTPTTPPTEGTAHGWGPLPSPLPSPGHPGAGGCTVARATFKIYHYNCCRGTKDKGQSLRPLPWSGPRQCHHRGFHYTPQSP